MQNTFLLLDFESKSALRNFSEDESNKKSLNIICPLDIRKVNFQNANNAHYTFITHSGNLNILEFFKRNNCVIHYLKIFDNYTQNNQKYQIGNKWIWTVFKPLNLSLNISTLQYTEQLITSFSFNRKRHPFLFSHDHDMQRIIQDIAYLKDSAILTSRLASFIYKTLTMDFSASTTKVGKLFAGNFGKSKIYNNKKYDINNTKGYQVQSMQNYRMQEDRIRIAKYLLQNTHGLNLKVLSEATGLDINYLNSLKQTNVFM